MVDTQLEMSHMNHMTTSDDFYTAAVLILRPTAGGRESYEEADGRRYTRAHMARPGGCVILS